MKILNSHLNLEKFFMDIKKSSGLLLMLDYDGTIAPFNVDRQRAFPYQGIWERLKVLIAFPKIRLVIVSGRGLLDLAHLLNLNPSPEMWGSHGLERKWLSGKYEHVALDQKTLKTLEKEKQACLSKMGFQHCEIKPFAVAVHWRGLDEASKRSMESSVRQEWEKISKHSNLEVFDFDEGIELRPQGKNKGYVIRTLLNEVPNELPKVYIGDDKTDEQAFAELGNDGLKVLVGDANRPTLADIQISAPEELQILLDKIITCFNYETS